MTSLSRLRILIGAVGAPAVFTVLWFAPLPLEDGAHRLAAVFAAVLLAWVSEVIPIAATALLIAPLLTVTGVTSASEAFRHYAAPLLYLFVGGFFIAEAMSVHGLDRRIARAVVGHAWVGGRLGRVRVAMMIAGGVLSMWISNTATTAILVPILLSMVGPGPVAGRGSLLAVAYGCSVGGLGTLVGSPPNLIAVGVLAEGGGPSLGFLEWMMIGVPTGLSLAVAIYVVTRWLFPPPAEVVTASGDDDAAGGRPWSQGELATAFAFGLAVVGWVVPGVCRALDLPFADALRRALHPGVVAVLAASTLFLIPDGRGGRALTWRQATRIDWGIILLFGGGLALGTQLVDTGLARAISGAFVELTGIRELWTLTAFSILFTVFFTEVCSNTASSSMLVPLAVSIAAELGVSPVPPALGVGLAASCAFMLPIATGPNAIAYSTGRVSQGTMIVTGLILNGIATGIVFALLRLLCPLYGWS